MKYRAIKCTCPGPCSNWLVTGVADVQGVSFIQKQAEAVARLLNGEGADEAMERAAQSLDALLGDCRCGNVEVEEAQKAIRALKVGA